ncbi:MAG TPA: hypothetical protein EYQ21_02515 [Flavobacteriales bacterium]|nr:hypothetical protein [Flavobacteriales bacterium]
MKVVINTRFGGFGLSDVGEAEITRRDRTLAGRRYPIYWDIDRTNPALVQMVEENSVLYSGSSADLRVVEVPDDVEWHIHDYDGREHVAENHRTWFS